MRKELRHTIAIAAFGLVMAWMTPILVSAQDAAASAPAKPQAMTKDVNPDWDVATVKPSNPNDTWGQHIQMHGRYLALLDTTAEQFLLLGYGVQKSQVVGVPEWAKTEKWDVNGVPDAEGQPSLKQMEEMIQRILAERFGLKLHREHREMPVFALAITKGGPKLAPDTSDPNGLLKQQNWTGDGQHVEQLKNVSMAELTQILQFHVDRPVVDQTGLKGRYDLDLRWATDDGTASGADAPPGLFTAIQEQIGLKLEPVKAPADVLVIDKLEKPGAN
jgi:uncharacterized protein (TIGR03435 family)